MERELYRTNVDHIGMEALSCSVCTDRYNLKDRPPKVLKCGHCFCLPCLMQLNRDQGWLQCPACKYVLHEGLKEIIDNQAIKDILISWEVRCPKHGIEVETYCVGHMEVVCAECGHTGTEATCIPKSLMVDTQEIHFMVLREVDRLNRDLPAALRMPEIHQAFEKRFMNKIGQNVQLLERMKEAEKTTQMLLCKGCGNVANNYVEIMVSFNAFCSYCAARNVDYSNLMPIAGKNNDEIALILASRIPTILKKVNFSSLTLELLDLIHKRASLTPKAVQQLGKELLRLEGPRADFTVLPDTCICPGCKASQLKSMWILPCMALHALCETCVGPLKRNTITCPLDLMTFRKRPEELQRLTVSPREPMINAYPRPELQGIDLGLASVMRPTGSQMSVFRPGPEPLLGPTVPTQGGFKADPALRSNLGIPLPSLQLSPDLPHLIRFPRVFGEIQASEGWFIHFAKNQVEAVTISVSDACRLVAVGIANPVHPRHVAKVESVSLYSGTTASGSPIAIHQGSDPLLGGNQLLTYVSLHTPFPIPAITPVTLKIKLVAPPSNPSITGIELYRGNPFARPDTWLGSDGLKWEFEETLNVGTGEFANGENHLSGPILAFIYQH